MRNTIKIKGRSRQIHIFFRPLLCLILLFFFGTQIQAFEETNRTKSPDSDSIVIGLITCSPGEAAYELFGHTAIRIQYPARKLDAIFNYGMFSFNTPNFIYRFTKGETDYWLGVQDTQDFLVSYALRNSTVTEQVLNLTPAEAHALFSALIKNCQPQNRVYRYNFLYDNCSTRARDIIAQNIRSKIIYDMPQSTSTFREWINQYTNGHAWLTFGINLVLGSSIDKPITYAESMFLPDNLMQAFEKALLQNDTLHQPLIGKTRILVEKDPEKRSSVETSIPLFKPLYLSLLLLFFVCGVTVYECSKGETVRWVDTLLFTLYGTTGCVVFFLMFISEHPATYPNYNGFWLHPFHLFAAIAVWFRTWKSALYGYHLINLLILIGLMLSWAFIPQKLALSFLILALVLAVRSVSYLAVHHSDFPYNLFQRKIKNPKK